MPRSTRSWLVVAIAGLALLQTLAYALYLRDDPGNYNAAGAQGDQVAYIELAQQILHGNWQGAVHYMPGLPAVIALGQTLVGDPRLGIALVQGLVYAAVVVLGARLAANAFGDPARLWAAASIGLNPALGYYAAQALTEFLTGALLLAVAGTLFTWARRRGDLPAHHTSDTSVTQAATSVTPSVTQAATSVTPSVTWGVRGIGWMALAGALIGAAGYLRSEYLGLAVVFAGLVVALVAWIGRARAAQATAHAAILLASTGLVMAPWVARYAVATGKPALYNESPLSNMLLMGTWFRVFDEQTFSELQRIETAPGPREDAIQRAATVGTRPELAQRYMEQARGPYARPLGETLSLMAGNIQLNWRQYAINHFVLAPVLIWAGHTPVRQADAPHLPSSARYAMWGAELLLLALALWQAILALTRTPTPGAFDAGTRALALSFLGIVAFLTAIHVIIAVDERFTTPALPLIGLFAGARAAQLVRARQHVAVGYVG